MEMEMPLAAMATTLIMCHLAAYKLEWHWVVRVAVYSTTDVKEENVITMWEMIPSKSEMSDKQGHLERKIWFAILQIPDTTF